MTGLTYTGSPKHERQKNNLSFRPLLLLHGGLSQKAFAPLIKYMQFLPECGTHYLGTSSKGKPFVVFSMCMNRHRIALRHGKSKQDRAEYAVRQWILENSLTATYYSRPETGEPFYAVEYDTDLQAFSTVGSFNAAGFSISDGEPLPKNVVTFNLRGGLTFWITMANLEYARRSATHHNM